MNTAALLLAFWLGTCLVWGQEAVVGMQGESVQMREQEKGVGLEMPSVSYHPSVRVEELQHWSVKPLEARYRATTAMNARFRSISPRTLQIWYDNGEGGSKMGRLKVGQETTTNTYETHEFFFTDLEKGDKVEVFRARMRNDKVRG
jgi:hypothetical protein